MKSKGINRILQIIERVENQNKELLSEGYDVSGLRDYYFNSSNGKICNDDTYNSCSNTVEIIADATDEVIESNSTIYWDEYSNYWIVKFQNNNWVIRVKPNFNTNDDQIEVNKDIEQQKSGSGQIVGVYYIQNLT